MNRIITLAITVLVLLVIEWYGFQAVRTATQSVSPGWQRAARLIYWSVPGMLLLTIVLSMTLGSDFWGRFRGLRIFFYSYILVGYLSKLFMIPMLLIDDAGRLVRWAARLFSKPEATPATASGGEAITRSEFLAKAALVTAAIPAVGFTWGIISGAHDYRVRKITLKLKNLPRSFEGLRIAQVSDIHSGSFYKQNGGTGRR